MSERVSAQNKTSVTPPQANQASSPLLRRQLTEEVSESVGSNSNISKELGGIQPKTIRRSLNWQNITVEAPSRSAERSLPGGIQRSEAAIAPDATVKVPDRLREQAPGGANYVDLEGVEEKTIRMYEAIAAMTDDVAKIVKNTGIPEHYIAKVKEHLFLKEHELEVANHQTREIRREKGNFSPFDGIANPWMLAINKSMQVDELSDEFTAFKHLIAHEYIEARLMDDGLPYRNPNSWREHPIYGWGNYPEPGDKGYGAHNLSPNSNPHHPPFGHWEKECDKSPEGLSLAKDISNLDELFEKIKKIIKEEK
jgi:hypothetical protein